MLISLIAPEVASLVGVTFRPEIRPPVAALRLDRPATLPETAERKTA